MKTIPALLLLLFISHATLSQKNPPTKNKYQDISYSSKVFGKEKFYRLYLPEGYQQTQERFPVIYFFHGWGGRHFKDDNANLEYEMISDLVDKYRVILVMWDGNVDEKEPRPYNMGNHENITSEIQMKDYFTELVSHIDGNYRTLTDRTHRGIIGFSMGGLMSFFLAGKYPDKICAAVSMTGSTEFFIGTPANQTLYSLRYVFKNLEGVKIRLHNSSHDELVFLNAEVNSGALWEGNLFYEYWRFVGGHMVDERGKTDVFDRAMKFVVDAFNDPLPKPDRWWHYDLYPEFAVWDYRVTSNKNEPGFIFLKNVSSGGFGFHSRKWLPDGPPIQHVSARITTAPIYPPNTTLSVIQYTLPDKKLVNSKANSDAQGRVQVMFEREAEAGIFKNGDPADLVVVDYELAGNRKFLRPGEENKLVLKIFNRGGEISSAKKINLELILPDSSFSFIAGGVTAKVTAGHRVFTTPPFTITTSKEPPLHADPAWIKLRVNMEMDQLTFKDEIVLPVFYDVPALDSIRIDDGRAIKGGVYGKGNGDGSVAPGEEVMVYSGNHRLRIYTDDPFVQTEQEKLFDEVLPAKWPDGFTLSSITKVSTKCPNGHVIECLASFETKRHMPIERKVTWGKVLIRVGGGR